MPKKKRKTREKTVGVSFLAKPSMIATVRAMADAEGISLSAKIRQLVIAALAAAEEAEQ